MPDIEKELDFSHIYDSNQPKANPANNTMLKPKHASKRVTILIVTAVILAILFGIQLLLTKSHKNDAKIPSSAKIITPPGAPPRLEQ